MASLARLQRDARMYLSRALNLSLAPPDRLSINLTLRCNLACAMCTTCYDEADELGTDEICDLIDQAALWGVEVFNPLGGEPFVRPDLERILAHACQRDFTISLTTNATLITPRRAERLAAIPPDRLHLNISLDGPEPVNDRIRGKGQFARAMRGYRLLREADARAGNVRRKVLANTLIHRLNLDVLPAFLDELEAEGFDGVQLLNLFRHGRGPPDDPGGLWIHPPDLPRLEALVEELVRRVRAQGRSGFRIQNPEGDLRLVPTYYRDELQPLQAPCWSGWKELYINADGAAIMCDGQLEFLRGTFGNARRHTLRELWHSPELRARRRVVKRCDTPCIQNCYLRRESDSMRTLLRAAAGAALEALRDRLRRLAPAGGVDLPAGVLTLELSDTAPWPDPEHPAPWRHFQELVASAPAPVEDCYRDPFAWYAWRDRGYVRFDRGFMGFELVRAVLDDLDAAGIRFGTLQLHWRGEPLLHPELVPVLKWVFQRIEERGTFGALRIRTDGRLLNTEIADVASFYGDIRQTWIIQGDRVDGWEREVLRNVDYFLHVRRPTQRVLAAWEVREDPLDPAAWVDTWRGRLADPWVAVGRAPEHGDGIWFQRSDHHRFTGDQAAEQRLRAVAAALDLPVDLPDPAAPRRCPGPIATPVVSWDGKVTLCPRDRALRNRVGEVTSDRLSRIWLEEERVLEARRAVRTSGVPPRELCRDCHFVYSPNYRQARPEELRGDGPGGLPAPR